VRDAFQEVHTLKSRGTVENEFLFCIWPIGAAPYHAAIHGNKDSHSPFRQSFTNWNPMDFHVSPFAQERHFVRSSNATSVSMSFLPGSPIWPFLSHHISHPVAAMIASRSASVRREAAHALVSSR